MQPSVNQQHHYPRRAQFQDGWTAVVPELAMPLAALRVDVGRLDAAHDHGGQEGVLVGQAEEGDRPLQVHHRERGLGGGGQDAGRNCR